mmetsp:Transcript_25752/g.37422  ORF Transcript_25752/g.37422 Transcript_25752/m.37422 type:complete len:832 (+) Transcript_25752:45-2540(+)
MDPSEAASSAAVVQSLQIAVTSWSKFDLDSRRSTLEKTALECKRHRDDSQAARKRLGEITKMFKRSVKHLETTSTGLPRNDATTPTLHSIESLAKECRSTVKYYQEEIDNLTRRCKHSDSAFLNLHQAIGELPDPAHPLLSGLEHVDARTVQVAHLIKGMDEMKAEMDEIEGTKLVLEKEIETLQRNLQDAMEQAAVATSQNEVDKADVTLSGGINKAEREELIQLRSEVAEYEVEFRGLKNQDITIRKLEAKIVELQENRDNEINKQLKKAQEDLAETEGRRAAEALEREAAMERRLQSVELELRAERAGREATQVHLLEADEGAGEREAAWEAQRQILVDDAERLREMLHDATRERDEFRLRVAALDDADETKTTVDSLSPTAPGALSSSPVGMAEMMAERKAFEAEVAELTVMSTSLREELRSLEESTTEEKRAMQSNIKSLERERNSLSLAVSSLEAELANAPSQSSIEKMKHELRILKRLEYNVVDADAEKDPEMTTGGEKDNDDDLETVLVAKLRKMETELLRERREKGEYLKERDGLKSEVVAAESAKIAAEELVACLEEDLQRAISSHTVASTTDSKTQKDFIPLPTPSDPNTLQQILDPTATPISSTLPKAEGTIAQSSPLTAAAAERANDDHSVATIILAQRDRLRARCDALEAERDSFKRELQVQVQAAESLKSDNAKLYEKVRYLQNFSSKSSRMGGSSGTHGRNNRIEVGMGDRDLDLEALEQRYEASVDPFRQFGRAERQRKLREMSPMERVVFIVAKTVLGSKEMRKALFFYVIGMHLLVFITTYHWSHELGCETIHQHEALKHFHGGMPLPEVPT